MGQHWEQDGTKWSSMKGKSMSFVTKHSLYTFRISCGFRVLLMPRKNKPQNPLTFLMNGRPWCEMLQNAKSEKKKGGSKCEKSDAKYPTIHFLFFAFRIHFRLFCDKCVDSLIGKITDICLCFRVTRWKKNFETIIFFLRENNM